MRLFLQNTRLDDVTKEEINKTILSLQTDEEIIDFVKKRIQ